MTPLLDCKRYGSGEPIFILHGLFGCRDNWHPVAKALSRHLCVYVPDLRNHGRSFHSPRFDYNVMADDIRRLMNALAVERATLLGHSMGGKAAMRLTVLAPERINRLIVVDITPHASRPIFSEAVEALCKLNLRSFARLKDIDECLRPDIPDAAVRLFLLKNLKRSPAGGFCWKFNLHAIRNNLDRICGDITVRKTPVPCLFIRGGRSDHLQDADWPNIRRIFPRAQLATVQDAGHWVHIDAKSAFLNTVEEFLTGM
jgi:pimeloyl-ACP methyl ester carboxylesterase